MLFDQKMRTDLRPKIHTETEWEYLDQSGRPAAEVVRQFLEHWISIYPAHERSELESRIRSNQDTHFKSAIFELILYAVFLSLGCNVEIHPEIPGGKSTRPDFLVQPPSGSCTYVEAVLASEYSAEEVAAQKRTAVVLQLLENINSPNFFLGFHAEGHPDHPPSGKRLRTEVSSWLSTLDPDSVSKEIDLRGREYIPEKTFNLDGWAIELSALPIKPDRRGKGQRTIGAISHGVRWVNTSKSIRDAICAKGRKYGALSHPFLIATNVDSMSLDRTDEMEALFGQEEIVFNRNNLEEEPDIRRKENGAWNGPNGPQYTRVSGAWIFDNLSVWNLPMRKNTVYFNPYAQRLLPDTFLQFPNARPNGDVMEWNSGASVGDILGITEGWPEA